MTTDITSVITAIIGVAGTALVGVITAKLVPWLKSKFTATQLTTISQWIKSGVKAAETLIPGSGTGKKKFQYVLDSIKTACSTHHITYDETAVKNEIQAVWNDLYNELNPSATQVTETAKTDATAKALAKESSTATSEQDSVTKALKSAADAVQAAQKAISWTGDKVTAETDKTAEVAAQA